MASKKISELISSSLLPLSGVTAVVYSGTTYQSTLSTLRQTLVDSGSHVFTGSQTIIGNLVVSGSLTAQQYILSSSITNITTETISGSSNFGNSSDDIHSFTGSLRIDGRIDRLLIGTGSYLTGVDDDPEVLHVANSGSFNIAYLKANNSYYAQINIKNINSGSFASTDLVLTADNGNESIHYVDLGINSSGYGGSAVGWENDAYLINSGKDLYVGTLGGTQHPAEVKLFTMGNWIIPQITLHTGSNISFNTSSTSDGFEYEFSGSAKFVGSILSNDFTGSLDYSNLINVPTLISGSSQISYTGITDIPNNIISSSLQILENSNIISSSEQLPSGLVSGSSQISYTGITDVPLGLVSGSSQISYSGITDIPNGLISGSEQLPSGLVSGSSQISYTGITDIPNGIISGSEQLPSDLVSGSSQISYTGITDIPSDIISSSLQVLNLGFSTTGSNTFNGDQIINGSLTIEGVSEVLTVDGSFGGNRDFDYTSGSIFYLTGVTGNGTWNVNNVPTTNNRGVTITFVVNQDSTPYSASVYSINSSPIIVKWGESSIPTGSANKVDIIGLTAFRVGSSWNVVGSLSSFGS